VLDVLASSREIHSMATLQVRQEFTSAIADGHDDSGGTEGLKFPGEHGHPGVNELLTLGAAPSVVRADDEGRLSRRP
jgi:hypothetical protein